MSDTELVDKFLKDYVRQWTNKQERELYKLIEDTRINAKQELKYKVKILEWIHDEVIDGYDDLEEARQAISNEYVKSIKELDK